MSAPSLFDYLPTAGVTHRSPTSTEKDAAKRTKPRVAYVKILRSLAEREGNAYQVWDRSHAGAYPHVVATRLSELEAEGLVERTDREAPTGTGSKGLVWVIVDAGRDYLAGMGE